MIDPTLNSLSKIAGGANPLGPPSPASGAGASSFADMLKQSIGEVSKLQQDATQAVNDVATGKSENMTGVMTAVEKSDLAFKTLLAIRAKLIDAYDEIKQIGI
jgi:flagellar hook-basal body complex protein FliE